MIYSHASRRGLLARPNRFGRQAQTLCWSAEGGAGLNDYELMFILAPDLEDEAVAATTDRVRSYVTSRGGDVRSLELWGRRRLAYPIQRYHEGNYHLAHFTLDPEQALELDRNLKLNEQVIRHMLIRLD